MTRRRSTPAAAPGHAYAALAAAVACLLVVPETVCAQRIRIVMEGAVDAGTPALPLVEPHVRVDPADPDHVVVGAIVAAPDRAGPWHCAALTSFDRGGSWTRTDFGMERCIDPWVTFPGGDSVMVTGIELLSGVEGGDRFRLVAFHSGDGGRRWTAEPSVLGRSFDHPALLADGEGTVWLASRRMRETGSGHPRHTVYLGRSLDGGRAFDDLVEVRPSNLALIVTGLERLSDGTIVVGYADSQRNVDGFQGAGMLARSRAWVLRSAQGRTVSEPLFVTDECASGVESAFPGYAILVADTARASSYRDRLYHACVRPGLDGIAVARSSDGGDIWSDPVRAAGAAPGEGHARTPMLAVSRAGVVGAAWYDRSHDPDRACQHTWFTASTDGGASFAEPVRITDVESCPEGAGNGRVARSWPMGGDYSSLTAAPDGSFRLVWADSRSGRFRLRTARIEVEPEP